MTKETQSAFAKRIGVQRSYVHKLKTSGRIVMTEDNMVDVSASIASLKTTTDPSKPSNLILPADPTPRTTTTPDAAAGSMSYNTARTVKEKYAALSAKLDYERACGKLLVTSDVLAVIAAATVTLRTRFQTLPDLLAPQIAAINDEHKVRSRLAEEIDALLDDVAEHFKKLSESPR